MKTKIIDILKQCYDPEIPIDLWNLGLIYDIDVTTAENDKRDVKITMSLTTPGCTMGQHMADDIKNKVKALEKINNIKVTVTFDPPWTPEMMTDYAREKLGYDPIKTKELDQEINVEWE
ncbi:MAG: metal-sulfur cluster assembly factor [Candidatus Neomarinimicrobiota bacterium]|nr:MAG: hypothetical protein CBB66_00070 [bacterium TMED6]